MSTPLPSSCGRSHSCGASQGCRKGTSGLLGITAGEAAGPTSCLCCCFQPGRMGPWDTRASVTEGGCSTEVLLAALCLQRGASSGRGSGAEPASCPQVVTAALPMTQLNGHSLSAPGQEGQSRTFPPSALMGLGPSLPYHPAGMDPDPPGWTWLL